MEAAAVNTATAPPQSPSPQRTQPPPQLPSQQRMPQLSTSPQRTQPSRPMPGTPTLRPPAPRAPAPPATSGIPAAGRPPVPPRVTVHLAPYNGLSSVVQWWLNFLSYVQLYQLTDDQAINILPFYFTEPVKHWFYQLEANARSSLSQFKLAFFSRFRKNDEDLDLDDIKQGQEEDIDSFLFRLQQAASDLNITEVELTKKSSQRAPAKHQGPCIHEKTEDHGRSTTGGQAGGAGTQHVQPHRRRHNSNYSGLRQCSGLFDATAHGTSVGDGVRPHQPSTQPPTPSSVSAASTTSAESTTSATSSTIVKTGEHERKESVFQLW